MEYAEILHRCFRCGYCKLPGTYLDFNCPSYLKYRFETFSPGGRMWLLRGWLDGEIQTSPRLAEILYSCATCGNCVEHCVFDKFKDNLVKAFIAGREELVDQGLVPPVVRDTSSPCSSTAIPISCPRPIGGIGPMAWTWSLMPGRNIFFWPAVWAPMMRRGQKMARAAAGLLKTWGVYFGILGTDEHCDGSEVSDLGEKGAFSNPRGAEHPAISGLGVKKVITLSPHAFHAFKEDYLQGRHI